MTPILLNTAFHRFAVEEVCEMKVKSTVVLLVIGALAALAVASCTDDIPLVVPSGTDSHSIDPAERGEHLHTMLIAVDADGIVLRQKALEDFQCRCLAPPDEPVANMSQTGFVQIHYPHGFSYCLSLMRDDDGAGAAARIDTFVLINSSVCDFVGASIGCLKYCAA